MAVSGLNCSGRFPDFFLAVLTDINPFLRFLYELHVHVSKKYQVPYINLC